MRWRLPHLVVGSLCVGCALANVVRVSALSAVLVAVTAGALALVVTEPRLRAGGAALVVALGGWAWGSVRLTGLDRTALASRIGTVERALVEVAEPPKAGSFDQRARAVLLRW